jgi:two-component system, OmpR family, response regulator VicR
MQTKMLFTTGEIAKYCGVNLRTVIRWIEKGILKAFQLPGRGDNRVKLQDFLVFLKDYGLPIPVEFQKNKKRVLIVEDNLSMAAAMERVIRRAGFDTKIALDGFKAGALLMSFQPDVVTLDLKMPWMNGHDFLHFTREMEEIRHTKILVVSAMDRNELKLSLEEGADDFLEKPYKNEELLGKIMVLAESGEKQGNSHDHNTD